MKNKFFNFLFALVGIICIVNLIILVVLVKKKKQPIAEEKKHLVLMNDTAGKGGFNIAVIDIDSLLRNYKFYKELEAKLVSKQKSLEAELQRQMANFEREVQDFQKKAQTGSFISQESARVQEQALYDKQQELINKRDEYSKQILEDHQKLEKQLYDTIISVLKDYGYDKKYPVIINKTSLVISDKCLEITDTLLNVLNNRYDKWAKKKK